MNIKGHRSRYYAQYTNGRELCTTSVNIQMSTIFDGRNFRMDRIRIVCTDNGGDLFMGDFEWVEETKCVEVGPGYRSTGVAVAYIYFYGTIYRPKNGKWFLPLASGPCGHERLPLAVHTLRLQSIVMSWTYNGFVDFVQVCNKVECGVSFWRGSAQYAIIAIPSVCLSCSL